MCTREAFFAKCDFDQCDADTFNTSEFGVFDVCCRAQDNCAPVCTVGIIGGTTFDFVLPSNVFNFHDTLMSEHLISPVLDLDTFVLFDSGAAANIFLATFAPD